MDPNKTPILSRIGGLKCDNPECDYKDDTIDVVDYEQHVDKSCPDCGESLLTQADYDKVVKMQQAIQDLNNLFGDMAGLGMPTGKDTGKRVELDLSSFLGDDENMNEEIKRFNNLI